MSKPLLCVTVTGETMDDLSKQMTRGTTDYALGGIDLARQRSELGQDIQRSQQRAGEDYNTSGPGNVTEVVEHVKQVRQAGMGVISMKLVGEGSFTSREDRKAAMRFAFKHAGVTSVSITGPSNAPSIPGTTRS